MIEDTQKNVDQIRSKLGPSHASNSGLASQASAAKLLAANGNLLNNFNSQSCHSLSSHRGYQYNHSNGNGVPASNLALSGLGDHQRSILIEDPPKSYRSGRQEITGM